jgi:hypothetical protein
VTMVLNERADAYAPIWWDAGDIGRPVSAEGYTFISHALAGGRSLAEVRDAAGHTNVSITRGLRSQWREESSSPLVLVGVLSLSANHPIEARL